MPIVNATIDLYKDFATREEGGFFRDYLFQASLSGDDGNNYFMNFFLSRIKNLDSAAVNITREPLWFFTTPSRRIIDKGEKPVFEIRKDVPVGAMQTVVSESAVTIKADAQELICTPPTYRLKYQEERISLDLKAESLGIPFWFNEGKGEGAPITPSSSPVHGIELFVQLSGSMILEGKKIGVKGCAVHEHTVSKHVAWMEFGWQDWIWFVFDNLYGLLFNMQGGGYKDGGIYLMKEKEYLVAKDWDIDHTQWAYSPTGQRYVPVGLIARAKTEKGMLFIEGNCLKAYHWMNINKYKQAVGIGSTDLEMRWTGKFTYNDGREITLNNGRGADEVIAVYNFVQNFQ